MTADRVNEPLADAPRVAEQHAPTTELAAGRHEAEAPEAPAVLAVVPVRDGQLPAGGLEVVAEAGGHALVAGSGTAEAAAALQGIAVESVRTWETPTFAPAAWASSLAAAVAGARVVLLPASPDGRDLAPRLAAVLGRRLVTGAVEVTAALATCTRWGGRTLADLALSGPSVVTLQPGVRGVAIRRDDDPPNVVPITVAASHPAPADPEVLEVLPPDVATMDLAEAPRILGGGAGLGGAVEFELLGQVATALGASVGATRVVTDGGVLGHDRQIGTTGVAVDPRLYMAFGVSGAVQHTAGLGDPAHIVSVNTDPHCPMMAMADLAVVADAAAVVRELASLLAVRPAPRSNSDD